MPPRGLRLVDWPSGPPDSNPMEQVWNLIKDWIWERYGRDDKLSDDTLEKAVREAWDAVTEDQLRDLVNSMRARSQVVIDANGRYTKDEIHFI